MNRRPKDPEYRRIYCNVDSRDRVTGTSDSYTVKIQRVVNVRGVRVTGVEVPNSLYTINSEQIITVITNNGSYSVKPFPIGIPISNHFGIGNKNIGLNYQLPDQTMFKIYFDQITFKVYFYANQANVRVICVDSELCSLMGLVKNEIYALVNDNAQISATDYRRNIVTLDNYPVTISHPSYLYFQSWVDNTQSPPGVALSLAPSLQYYAVAPKMANFNPSPYIYLQISEFSRLAQAYSVASNSKDSMNLIKIPLNQETGKYVFFIAYKRTDMLEFFKIEQDTVYLDELTVNWFTYNGSKAKFNGVEHSFQLELLIDPV